MDGDTLGAIAMMLAPLVLIILWELDDLGERWQARKARKQQQAAERAVPRCPIQHQCLCADGCCALAPPASRRRCS